MTLVRDDIAAILMLKNENRFIKHEDGSLPKYTMLEQNIRRLLSLVGYLYIVDNGSDDGSQEVYHKYKDRIAFIHFNKADMPFDDVRDRSMLLENVLHDKRKWALIVDGDEIYEDGTNQWMHEFCNQDYTQHYAAKFHYVNVWRGRMKYRTDAWCNSWFTRLFSTHDLVLQGTALHNYQFGFYHDGRFDSGKVMEAPVKCLHYGWADWNHRVQKTLRYMKRDMEITGINYEDAKGKYAQDIDENGLKLNPCLPQWASEFRDGVIDY